MALTDKLLEKVAAAPPVVEMTRRLADSGQVYLKGAYGSLKSLLLAHLYRSGSGRIVYVAADGIGSEEVKEDLESLVGEERVAFFPGSVLYGMGLGVSQHLALGEQLRALEALSARRSGIVVAHAFALLQNLPPRDRFAGRRVTISVGDEIEFQSLVARLLDLGFVREARVERSGEMCVRGGLVDVYPFSAEYPYRIEFWGDTVESLRIFDPVTQRSLESTERLTIYPQEIDEGDEPPQGSLLDYFDDDVLVVLDEPELIRKHLTEMLEPSRAASLWQELEKRLDRLKALRFVSIGNRHPGLVRLGARGQETLNGDLKLLKASLTRLDSELRNGSPRDPAIFFVCDTPHQRERLEEIFVDEGLSRPNLRVEAIRLHKGFVFPEAGLVLFTDSQFYGRTKRLRLPKKAHRGLTPKQLRYLREGDYVVHVDFGIGIFRGLKKITVRGHERECLHLEYKDGDTVYVRVERMDRVHKYSSKDGAAPVLSKLGSPNWQRLKRRTKKRIQDIAKELIELYARRQAEGGITFEQDSLWQQELEASFPFEDTPDQIKATLDVKRDMESPKPMDRLVCGDVGFGKTEIAVRAAFKAVMSQKQVAMLVPTTILAYQHYNTFRQRLEKFPVRVEMLSRFRTTGEQRRILAQLAAGQIDIVIGTHRLLSKDVHFKDLGLLIIDEEQRFGVRHKEHLKRLRATVDVLTLTATPIPRTLQFALMGARDMTNINTPPKNRLPIVTEILTFNKAYIREVILRELERGGQVFFVHNRVRSIERVARMLADLVPEADVAVAHGQMHEKELERVMIDFMERRFQILVSTMIIESGLDMPNVNTIIINRADRLGLAQLYQLRGRVGRSHQRAYAYLLIPPVESLTEDALKRLRAIEEFSEIGSGSLLALRDLEIRGAGNLLGAEQTGFIDSLGFELYTKIVEEAVRELKTEASAEPVPPEIDTRVEVDFEAALPQTYIESGSERVDLYRRLTLAQDVGELDALREEIEDRFGRLPRAVVNLLDSLALRMLGKKLGLRTVRIEKQEMVAIFSPDALAPQGEPFKKWLGSIVEKANQPFEFTQGEGLGVRLRFESQDGDQLSVARAFLSSLADA